MIKQVIVIRRDLKMRRGKECAQSGHAAMAWLKDKLDDATTGFRYQTLNTVMHFSIEELQWLGGEQKKVVCQVDSLEEINRLYFEACKAGLTAYVIVDSGHTEFNGQETVTCLAIGPNLSSKIDLITGNLKLY